MAGYVLSRAALRDLLDLEDFLTNREGHGCALTILVRLHRAMTSAADTPGMGRKRADLRRTGIEIVRVIDARRDIATLLGQK